MPLRDVTGAELAKLKRLVHGFGSGVFCLFVFFIPYFLNDLWCCSKSLEIFEILSFSRFSPRFLNTDTLL